MTQVRISWAQFSAAAPPPMAFGCPPGSFWFTFPAPPSLGAPLSCSTGDCSSSSAPARLGPLTPLSYRLRVGRCFHLPDLFTPWGAWPQYGNPVLDRALTMLARWQQQVKPFVPGAQGGPGQVNPANGNLVVRLTLPDAGAVTPSPILVYNSLSLVDPEFGFGWGLVPKQTLTSLTSTSASVADGTGTTLRYSGRDSSNYYLGPGGSSDALQFNPANGTWMQTQADGFGVHYNAGGLADYLATPAGNRWTLSYSVSGGRLQTITHPFQRRTTLSYNPLSFIRRIQQSDGRITTLTVDGSSNLVRCQYPDGKAVSLTYDSTHRIQAFIDARSQRTSYGYDSNGKLQSIQEPSGGRTTFAYQTGGATRVTDAYGGVTTLLFNLDRNISGVVNPLGQRATYLWSNHRLQSYQDGRGNRSTLTYVTLSNRTTVLGSVEDALSGRYTLVYSGQRLVALVDQLGQRATLGYDAAGNRTQLLDPAGGRTTYVFTPGWGQVRGWLDPLGQRSSLPYTGVGQIGALIDPLLRRVSLSYNAYGQVSGLLDPLGRRVSALYDALNRVTVRIDGLGARTTYGYDATGNLISQLDPLLRRSSLLYDGSNRQLASVNPLNQRVTWAYTPAGQPQRVTDALGRVSTTVYDRAWRVRAQVNALGARQTLSHDAAGNLVSVEDALGRRTTQVYNANDRLVGSVDGLGNRTTYVYDLAGRQTARIDGLGRRWTSVYDALDRLVGSINPLSERGTVVYDAASRAVGQIDGLGRRSSTVYDAA